MANKAKWTVLTYIAAHNNLNNYGRNSLDELLAVGSTSEVVLGALYDCKVGAARYVMGDPGGVEWQKQEGRFDSGDPDELIDTAKWLFEKYPAERYGLVLWSHGTGWEPSEIEEIAKEARLAASRDAAESRERSSEPGSRALFRTTLRSLLKPEKRIERAILFDDGTGHSLDTLELARVTDSIAKTIGQPLDVLGMDACLMANLEVAYEIRKAVRYLVASEELVPAHSWPYKEVFGSLRAKPTMTGAELAKLVVDRYIAYYTAKPPSGGDVTKVALDLGRIDDVVKMVNELAEALRADMSTVADALWDAQVGIRQRESRDGKRQPNKFDYTLWDMGSLAARLAESKVNSTAVRQAATNTVKALSAGAGAVLAEGHYGAWFDGIGGASVYFMPPGQQRVAPSYAQLAFAKDTQWGEMLLAYHKHFS
ncbi:MAG: clostripain-related cysteine peptidase [Nitrospira sp.]|nr:hypothetical protein [Nitrospira sp.]